MLSVKDHDKVTINNPGETTTKGSGCFSRFKTIVEVTGVELSKRRVFFRYVERKEATIPGFVHNYCMHQRNKKKIRYAKESWFKIIYTPK
jgi:hypothetical protein